MEQAPDFLEAHYQLGSLYSLYIPEVSEKAEQHFQKVIELDPQGGAGWNLNPDHIRHLVTRRGVIFGSGGSISEYQQSLDRDPSRNSRVHRTVFDDREEKVT